VSGRIHGITSHKTRGWSTASLARQDEQPAQEFAWGECAMAIDISPLERAIARLEEALEVYQLDTSHSLIRDGLVHRFEFTFELSRRLLKRYLEDNAAPSEDFDGMNFADLIRIGNEHGLLLGNWPRWREFRDMRAKTNHAYNEITALGVVAGIPVFLEDARYLRDRLRERQNR
jgi:nucleotidyltransferase substrate binding protein (TIGR01987 family)